MTEAHTNLPHPVDVHVGNRLRAARQFAQMSQTQLAEAAGVTFQQIQKYENGRNRISCSMLYLLSGAVNATPAYFFDGYAGAPTSARSQRGRAGEP